MSISHEKKAQRLKVVITIGIVAPSVARIAFPGNLHVADLASMVTIVTCLMWLWEF